MHKLALSVAIAGVALPVMAIAPAQAQATRTWVSGVGDDFNPCSRTAPCKTFAGAISKTFINGEINCLDPGGFGAVTITKSITIDCHEIFASILASGTTGVIINIAAGNSNDPLRTVRLRNLNINGTGSSGTIGTRTGIRGIRIINAAAVFVEDTLVEGFTNQGILDERTTGGKLFVSNSTLRNNTSAGVTIAPSSGSTRIDATLTNVLSENNAFGVAVGSGARVMVKRSTLSGNTNAGVETEGTAPELNVDDSVISSNALGFQQVAGTIRFSNSDISFNTGLGSGTANSFSNNRLSGNGAGGSIVAIAPANSNASGQQ